MKTMILIAVAGMIGWSTTVSAQTAKEKAESIASAFNKEKHKEKEKNGSYTKQDKVVIAKPDIRSDESEYTGKYAIEGMNAYIILKKSTDNKLEAVLTNDNDNKQGTLKDIKIEAGLLSAVLEHVNGKKEPFETAFISRTENGETNRGIGVKQLISLSNGFVVDKAFY